MPHCLVISLYIPIRHSVILSPKPDQKGLFSLPFLPNSASFQCRAKLASQIFFNNNTSSSLTHSFILEWRSAEALRPDSRNSEEHGHAKTSVFLSMCAATTKL